MAYRAVVDIPRAQEAVWTVLTDAQAWADWWGEAMTDVEPGWEVDGVVTWKGGGRATITDLTPGQHLELVSGSTGTRWSFQLGGGPGGGTRFTFVEDFSESTVEIGERDAKLAQNEATGARFRDAVVGRTSSPRKWWQLW